LDISQWPHIARVTPYQMSTFQGSPCDDTEYRDENGGPGWKNYGSWLSECDSLWKTHHDSIFAERGKKLAIEKAIQDSIYESEIANMDLDAEFNMDDMWAQAVWEEITEIMDTEVYETEQITAVAGVRGAEAEDEALAHLYYRKSMKGISQADYRKAYGKLKNKRDELFENNPAHPKLEKMDALILQLKNKIEV